MALSIFPAFPRVFRDKIKSSTLHKHQPPNHVVYVYGIEVMVVVVVVYVYAGCDTGGMVCIYRTLVHVRCSQIFHTLSYYAASTTHPSHFPDQIDEAGNLTEYFIRRFASASRSGSGRGRGSGRWEGGLEGGQLM